MSLDLSVYAVDQCVLCELRGECDLTTALRLREGLLDVLSRESARAVADLSGLRFLDCAGAGALLAADRRAALLDGQLVLAAPTAPVARLLEVYGLTRRLTIFPATRAALAAVQPRDQGPQAADLVPAQAGPPGGQTDQKRRMLPHLSRLLGH